MFYTRYLARHIRIVLKILTDNMCKVSVIVFRF